MKEELQAAKEALLQMDYYDMSLEQQCPHCGRKPSFRITTSESQVKCPFCRRKFPLSQAWQKEANFAKAMLGYVEQQFFQNLRTGLLAYLDAQLTEEAEHEESQTQDENAVL